MIHIDELFRQITDELIRNSQERQHVERNHVFQPANMKNRALVEKIIDKLVLPGSRIEGYEHLKELYERAKGGESCLILMEHFSNFDIPCLFYLAKQYEDGEPLTDSIVAMAGTKLNEESRFVLAFTEAYTRIVIYPARMLQALEGTEQYEEERARSRVLNRSALREMIRMKHSAHMVLLFPAGTRYRPGREETKRILLEVDSYLKGFDHVVFVGIAGNTLEVSPLGEMAKDQAKTDAMVYHVGPIERAADFRDEARRDAADDVGSAKKAVARAVERRFAELHDGAEAVRATILETLREKGVTPTRLNITTPE